jgi:hypothetical protein
VVCLWQLGIRTEFLQGFVHFKGVWSFVSFTFNPF